MKTVRTLVNKPLSDEELEFISGGGQPLRQDPDSAFEFGGTGDPDSAPDGQEPPQGGNDPDGSPTGDPPPGDPVPTGDDNWQPTEEELQDPAIAELWQQYQTLNDYFQRYGSLLPPDDGANSAGPPLSEEDQENLDTLGALMRQELEANPGWDFQENGLPAAVMQSPLFQELLEADNGLNTLEDISAYLQGRQGADSSGSASDMLADMQLDTLPPEEIIALAREYAAQVQQYYEMLESMTPEERAAYYAERRAEWEEQFKPGEAQTAIQLWRECLDNLKEMLSAQEKAS